MYRIPRGILSSQLLWPYRKTLISSRPSQHHPRFLLSTSSSFRTPYALTHPNDCTAVSWMSNGSIYTKIFSKMHSVSLRPMITIPSSDIVIEYVNTLGYLITLRNVSAMSINALYQPWKAILSKINMCLTGKMVGFDRPRHHVLQILWGITHRSNINYA
ncbi:hypothetical protein Tco_0107858 [Tanacetum coccineum]